MINKRLALMRKAARVTRLHTEPSTYRQSVGEHTFGLLAIIFELCDNPSTDMLRAALRHDATEAITGDVPSPAKWDHVCLMEALNTAEKTINFDLNLQMGLATPFENRVIQFADGMELAMFGLEEAYIGNIYGLRMCGRVLKSFSQTGVLRNFDEDDQVRERVQKLYDAVFEHHSDLIVATKNYYNSREGLWR